MLPSSSALAAALLLAAACTGDIGGDASNPTSSGSGGSGHGGSSSSGSGGTSSGTGGSTTSSGTGGSGTGTTTTGTTTTTATGGAPPCTAADLAEAVRITQVTIDGAVSSQAVTAEAGAGSFVAWSAAGGVIRITPLDVVDQRLAPDLEVEGTRVFGAAATASAVALLVSRPPDYMTFVRIDLAGTVLASTDLVGGGDHAVIGTEWFGEFATTGRLVGRNDGTYAAYHALHRRWPDNIGHQGDTLRLLDGQGAALGGWGWGCSHSMDERIAFGPSGLVPICIADCYPGKGIYFNHNAAQLTPDPGANCAGGYNTLLGGLVAVAGGFFLVYGDDQGGAHLGHFDAQGQPITDRALAVTGSSRLALYDTGMLLGSGSSTLQQLAADGSDLGQPATVPVSLPDQDFESRSNGEVAWASASGGTLSVVRVRLCQ